MVAAAALFCAGLAVTAFGAHTDAPLKSQTYSETIGDAPRESPDIGDVVVSNFPDGTLTFDVATPKAPVLGQYQSVSVLVDEDNDKTTGNLGYDYALEAVGFATPQPLFELYSFNGTQWLLVKRVDGVFTSLSDVSFTVPASLLHIGDKFDFGVRGGYNWGSTTLVDYAPDDKTASFDYVMGAVATTTATTTTTPTTTTVTTTPKPKPLPKCKKGQRSTAKHRCRKA